MLGFLFSPFGRIGRGRWWASQAIIISLAIVAIMMAGASYEANPSSAVLFLAALLCLPLWINICTTIKRYHDRDKSGWWFLFQFIPIIGPIWAFIELGFLSGTYGDNDYGPGPGMNIKDDLTAMLQDSEYSESYSTAQRMRHSTPSSYQPPKANYSGGTTFGKRG